MQILHVIESTRADAASAAPALAGLVHELNARGARADLVASSRGDNEHAGEGPVLAEVDLLHLHGWEATTRSYICEAARLNKPCVLSPLGQLDPASFASWGQRIRWRFGQRKLVRSAAVVTAANEWELDLLKRLEVLAHVELLPLGLGPDCFEPSLATPTDSLRCDERGRYFLVLGPIDPASGAAALLKALAEIGPEADGWHVVFAGRLEDHWRKMLEAAVRRKGGAERVKFVADPDLVAQGKLVAGCGMLVAPCMRARPPIAMMQAIAAGVPACGTLCAAPAEMECVTCAPNRPALREMLRKMLRRGEGERLQAAARLRETARQRSAWTSLVDRYIRLYRSLA